MDDLFAGEEPRIVRGRTLKATVAGLYSALGKGFETAAVDRLDLSFDGIANDVHEGATRKSGGREPWYRRGTEIRNERQLTIVAFDELAKVAELMGLAEVKPEWIGANLVVDGIERLSMLPAGSLMFFDNGVTLKVNGQNAPCRLAGKAIARGVGTSDVDETALLFPKVAKRLRGLTAWVEKPGSISPGEAIKVRVPEQWIY